VDGKFGCVWNERYDKIDDLERARGLPSPQLVGTPERATLDLNVLREAGVEVVGRLAAIRDVALFFPRARQSVSRFADLKWDACSTASMNGRALPPRVEVGPPERARTPTGTHHLGFRSISCGEIRSFVWATGLSSRSTAGLNVSVVNRKGVIRHHGGALVGAPGMYAIGLPVLRRRKSHVHPRSEDDAREHRWISHAPSREG